MKGGVGGGGWKLSGGDEGASWTRKIQKFKSKYKFRFGLIQFNKKIIQLENQGIEHHYGVMKGGLVVEGGS